MQRYNPKVIEPKWQKIWAQSSLYKTNMSRAADKFYIIPMLPYPSGDLHVGHWYNFGPTDTVARFHRMLGQNVLTTIGFDAFGLPAENAAIARGIQPAKWTHSNIKTMTNQIEQIGAGYDWDHTLITCDPEYYRWNQWLFLKLYEKGLAYRAKSVVNWCPKDQTVLANEQVVGENNVCERCGTPVIQKEMESWYFKITDYTERLLKDLENVDWPEKVKLMQINWIGKSQGALIDFDVDGRKEKIKVFTTRPDTIFGATYMVLAPEHPLAEKLASVEQKGKVIDYVNQAKRKTELERKEGEKDKTGVFTGSYAANPATKEKIPIWIADYVLMGYGTGAIMAVPAHDDRDHDFAKKFNLPIKQVIAKYDVWTGERTPRDNVETISRKVIDAVITDGKGKYLLIKESGNQVHFVGGGVDDEQEEAAVKREVKEESGYVNIKSLTKITPYTAGIQFRSTKNKNQRAYGNAYEVVLEDMEKVKSEADDGNHVIKWVKKEEVEDLLTWPYHLDIWRHYLAGNPDMPNAGEGILINSGKYDWTETAEAREKIVADLAKAKIAHEQTNYRLRDWLISRQRYWGTPIPIIYCGKCGTVPVPEKELPVILPEDVEFTPAGRNPLLDRPDFLDVKCPKCGGGAKRETDTMDTFVDSSWYFLRYLDNKNDKEPFSPEIINKWSPVDHYIGGIEHAILHLLYARFITKFLHDNYGLTFGEPFKKLTNQGIILGPDGQKMSKSRGNVVNPDEQVASYGADSLRLYLMFMGPYEQGGPYSLSGIAGTRRFLERIWTLVDEYLEAKPKTAEALAQTRITALAHKTIQKVTKDLESLSFNTAIAAMMAYVNELYKAKAEEGFNVSWQFAVETLLILLAPFAPHVAEELWAELGHDSSIHLCPWPAWDEKLVVEEMLTLAVQVNGRVRAEIVVPADISEEEAIKAAKAAEKIVDHTKGKQIKKAIYVPGRLVSLVI